MRRSAARRRDSAERQGRHSRLHAHDSLDDAVRELEQQQRSDAEARESAERARDRAEAEARAAKESKAAALVQLVQGEAARQAAEQALAEAEQDNAALAERARREEQRAARLATRLANLQRASSQGQQALRAAEGGGGTSKHGHDGLVKATPTPTALASCLPVPAADRTALQRSLHATAEELTACRGACGRLEAAVRSLRERLDGSEEELRRSELQRQALQQQCAAADEARLKVRNVAGCPPACSSPHLLAARLSLPWSCSWRLMPRRSDRS